MLELEELKIFFENKNIEFNKTVESVVKKVYKDKDFSDRFINKLFKKSQFSVTEDKTVITYIAAIFLFRQEGIDILKNEELELLKHHSFDYTESVSNFQISFSSINSSGFYWIQTKSNSKVLSKRWYIILNDQLKNKLYLFYFPLNSILEDEISVSHW